VTSISSSGANGLDTGGYRYYHICIYFFLANYRFSYEYSN